MYEKCFSLLLGSGFSVPEGLPKVSDINRRLCGLQQDEFYITSVQSAGFNIGNYKDPNDWSSESDRKFAQEFIKNYCVNFLNGDCNKFNYEEFYDYVSNYLRYKKNDENIKAFCDLFRKPLLDPDSIGNDYNLVWRFSKIFNQLVADLLVVPGYYEDVSYMNYPNYDPFFRFIKEQLKKGIVNVHTLNHDIFFDHMASKHVDLWQHFTDGFSEVGSPYYGEISIDHKQGDKAIHKNYKVRLKRYNGNYDNNLRLFKLHGSIDNCILYETSQKTVRVKRDVWITDFFKEEYNNESKKYQYESPFAQNEPDYLTGTTEKIRQYKDPFYDNLFSHFIKNLNNSDKLLVIGYGFQDRAINEFIENNFLIYNKKMIVIDVVKPKNTFFEQYKDQIVFSDKGAIGNTFEEYMKLVGK